MGVSSQSAVAFPHWGGLADGGYFSTFRCGEISTIPPCATGVVRHPLAGGSLAWQLAALHPEEVLERFVVLLEAGAGTNSCNDTGIPSRSDGGVLPHLALFHLPVADHGVDP